jgi:hypothetical protein
MLILAFSIDFIPFQFEIDSARLAGAGLDSLALYWGFSPLAEKIITALEKWFDFAERSLYTSQAEFDRTQVARDSQNSFYASVFSIFPFLIAGFLCDYIVYLTLGSGWPISLGTIGCIGCGMYELGRRQQEEDDEDE